MLFEVYSPLNFYSHRNLVFVFIFLVSKDKIHKTPLSIISHCFYNNLYSHTSFRLVCIVCVCVRVSPNDTVLFAFGVYFSLLIDRKTCTAAETKSH